MLKKPKKDELHTLDDATPVIEEPTLPAEVLPPEPQAVPTVASEPPTLCNVCGNYFTGTSTDHALSEHK